MSSSSVRVSEVLFPEMTHHRYAPIEDFCRLGPAKLPHANGWGQHPPVPVVCIQQLSYRACIKYGFDVCLLPQQVALVNSLEP